MAGSSSLVRLIAGIRVKVLWIMDHNIGRSPLVGGISLLDCIHIYEFDRNVSGIAGDLLNDSASHKNGDTWLHVLSSLIFGAYIGNLLYSKHLPEGALAYVVKPGKGRPVTLTQILGVLWNVPPLA